MVIATGTISKNTVDWKGARRIIRSVYPPIDLFEDIADPADWALLISAEQKTNPRLMERIGNLDQVPIGRRVGGNGASYLMAPFTHASKDRPSRFSNGSFGVLYVGNCFEVALSETVHHHSQFMARTNETPGWTSQFREIVLDIKGDFHDLRSTLAPELREALKPNDYALGQALGAQLRNEGANGIVYPSVRFNDGECIAAFYPDLAANPKQGQHLDYHWNGTRVDLFRIAGTSKVYRIVNT